MYSNILKALVVAGLGAGMALSGSGTADAQERRCDREARHHADRVMNRGEAALGSGLGGAAVGAIIGGIVGGGRGAGRGAIIGGSTGAVGGALGSGPKWQRAYDRAFENCMDRYEQVRTPVREVRPVYRNAIEPWTGEWYDYCRERYRTFNANDGTFRDYDGIRKFCQAE